MIFKHKVVQDLAFIIDSKCIYQDFDLSLYWLPNVQERLQNLDRNPEVLEDSIHQVKSHFLGSYFETLFSFAIKSLSTLEVIFEHKQLVSNGVTLGEIDMLARDPEGNFHQFELAVKFYLYVQKGDVSNWLGPNKNDSFAKKYHRAKQHQLTLFDRPESKAILLEFGGNKKINRHLMMFGFLYLRLPPSVTNLFVFPSLNKEQMNLVNMDSIQGYWVSFDDFSLLEQVFIQALELEKLNWLSAFKANDSESRKSPVWSDFNVFYQNLQDTFLVDERPRQFLIDIKGKQGEYVAKRFFVVPNNW